jgi:methionyl-tRNA formyltransferase
MATLNNSIMKKISEPIVFFGSGPVAAKSLELLAPHCTFEAVITKPRPAHHRGPVPVSELAETLHIPIYTAENGSQLNELFAKKPFRSRLAILIDFGIIVSQEVIDYFPLGIVNSHFSLLPEWRGADPITFSILSGQKQTGVSLMLLTAGLDEGPLLAHTLVDIGPETTTSELTARLITSSYEALCTTIPRYLSGEAQPSSQEAVAALLGRDPTPTYSRKLTKQDGILDWSKPATELEREVRAFNEWPKSRTNLGRFDVIITKAHVVDQNGTPGTLSAAGKQPIVYCGEQALALDRLKPAGKQEMTGQAFLAGYRTQL